MSNRMANEIGALRLAVLSLEYQLQVNANDLDIVADSIVEEFGSEKVAMMKELRSIIDTLKKKEKTLTKMNERNQIEYTLGKMVKENFLTQDGDKYKLTVLGEVYAKHSIKNNPQTKEFYRQLLESNGIDPATDEVLGGD